MRRRVHRPSPSMIVALIALSVALAGTGYAASKINGKDIKNSSIPGKKLKNKAVETKKIDKGAVTGSRIKASSTPFSRITHMATGDTTEGLGDDPTVYPLDDSDYTQGAKEVNTFVAALDVRFTAGCTQPREAMAYLLLDSPDPLNPDEEDVVAIGQISDESAGAVTRRINMGPYPGLGGTLVQPGTDESHTLALIAGRSCSAGNGVAAVSGVVNVIATK